MWNSKKQLQAALVLGVVSSLGFSAMALARTTDEDLSARAEAFEKSSGAAEASAASTSESSDYVTASAPGLVIYREGGASAAAKISKITRYKNYIFVLDEFEHGSRLVPYFTESGARSDFERIAAGSSIDLSSCMSEDQEISSSIDAEGCRSRSYTLKVDCGKLTSIGIHALSGAETVAYSIVDIDKSPLVGSSGPHCPNSGPKF